MEKKDSQQKTYLKPSHGGFWLNFFSSQRFVAIVALSLLALVVWPLAKNQNRQQAIDREIEEVRREIAEYEKQNAELDKMLSYVQSNSSLEEQARLNLGLKKPGETVVVIQETASSTLAGETDDNPSGLSNFSLWLQYFFGDIKR